MSKIHDLTHFLSSGDCLESLFPLRQEFGWGGGWDKNPGLSDGKPSRTFSSEWSLRNILQMCVYVLYANPKKCFELFLEVLHRYIIWEGCFLNCCPWDNAKRPHKVEHQL